MQTHEVCLLYACILYITGYDLASVLTSLHVATYVLVLHPTNRAANCGVRCELHDPVNSNKLEHKECSVIIFGCAYDSGSNVILLCMQSFVHVGQSVVNKYIHVNMQFMDMHCIRYLVYTWRASVHTQHNI